MRSGILIRSLAVVIVLFSTHAYGERNYTTDCSPNTRLRCRVEEGNCTENQRSDDHPSAPYDLRLSPYLVASPLRKPNSYELLVNVSWQPTHTRSIYKTRGFELTISDKDTNEETCFTFHLDSPQWNDKDRFNAVRFQFSALDVFKFGHNYIVRIQSLPKPLNENTSNYIESAMLMPIHPEQFWLEELNRTGYFEPQSSGSSNVGHCKSSKNGYAHGDGAHPHANKWMSAFRFVFVQPKAKFIYVDFVAAPPQYCFEEYELTLIRDNRYQVEEVVIPIKDLYYEMHGNVSVAFGNYTFQNVTPGLYEIMLAPVRYSSKDTDRCLCPQDGQICGCTNAIWPDVLMPDPPSPNSEPADPCKQLPPAKFPWDCPMVVNRTELLPAENEKTDGNSTIILACLLAAACFLIVAGILLLRCFYRRYRKRGTPHIYLLPMISTTDFNKTSDTIGTEMSQLLHRVKLLIIYSHDCPDHEASVRAFSEYLRSQCMCDVDMDYLSVQHINANKFDWAYKSIVKADRVLLINSYGAYMRWQAKSVCDSSNGDHNTSTVVERCDPDPYDDVFLLQLEFIVQCQQRDPNTSSKFVSVHFAYTPAQYLLPHANPNLRYHIPQHLRSLIIDLHQLHSCTSDEDEDSEWVNSIPHQLRDANKRDYEKCAEGERLRLCIENAQRYMNENPDWFERLHIRRAAGVVPITNISIGTSPLKRNGYVHRRLTMDEEQIESLLHPHTSEWSAEDRPKKPESTTDSGYEEPTTFDDQMDSAVAGPAFPEEIIYEEDVQYKDLDALGIDSNARLMKEKGPHSMANLDSCDSGIAADLNCTNSQEYPYYSPKTGSKLRHLNSEKRTDHPTPLERQRLIV